MWRRGMLCGLLWIPIASGVLAGDASEPSDASAPTIEFRLAEITPADGLTEATVPGQRNKIYLHATAAATGDDITVARLTVDTLGKPAISIEFSLEAARRMDQVSSTHLGKPMALLVDGRVVTAPLLHDRISMHAIVTGNFSQQEAARIVALIDKR